MVQGKQREVVNIGLGIKQVAVEPRDATVSAYVESLSHKVRATRSPTTRLPGVEGGNPPPPSPRHPNT